MKASNFMSMELTHNLFLYDPETGILRWRNSNGKRIRAGDLAGSPTADCYLRVRFNKISYLAHRICYALYHGEWPDDLVDHWDGDKNNNRPSNLRPATYRINNQNHAIHRAGKLVGASFRPDLNKWHSKIKTKGITTHLGFHDSEQQAHRAYMENVP